MSRHLKRMLTILIFLSFILNINFFYEVSTYAETSGKSRIDAVLVLDSSSSMKKSDPQGLRYEALKLFIDMCHDSGDSIGIAAYGGKILLEKKLEYINSQADKESIKKNASNIQYDDATDIGLGLSKAVSMLSEDKNTNASPVIILLSDGKNDPSRTVEQSDADIASSLKTAKDKGYPIYTIGLNADKTVDEQQLKKFSSETGGKSFITSKASDLPGILRDIFTDKFNLNAVPSGDLKLTGQAQELKFNVPDINTSEGNIVLMSSVPLNVKLFDPNNIEIKIPSNSTLISSSGKYTLIKLLSPKQGSYKMSITGQSGAVVNINYIFNYDLQLDAKFTPNSNIKKEDTIKIESYLSLNGQKVTDAQQYKQLKGEISVTDLKDNSIKTFPLTNSGTVFSGEYTVNDSGSYTIQVVVKGEGFYRVSSPFYINIDNSIPVINNKIQNMKLSTGETKKISLKDVFKDSDGDKLSFSTNTDPSGVVSAVIDNDYLKISSSAPGTCILTVTAQDGKGGLVKCDFQVEVSENKGFNKTYIYAAAGAAVLILAIILIIALIKKNDRKGKAGNKHKHEKIEKVENEVKNNIDFNGQVMIEIRDEATGIVDPPQFKRLENYNSEITLHELLLEMPEYAETKKIRLISYSDKILIKNRSVCIIEKNGARPDKNAEFYIKNGDMLNVKLLSSRKNIKIQYFVK